jgi:hypothetical protein
MGGRIDYAPDALVTEPVAPDRLSFGWLARAALPDGLTHAGVLMRRHGVSPWRAVPVAMAKLLACACLALPSQGIADGAQRRRCAGCFMPASWRALVGRRAPVIYGGHPGRGGPMNLRPQDSRGFGTDFLPDATANRSEEALAELLLAARRQFWVMVVGRRHRHRGALFHYATSPKTFEASATLLIEEQRAELEQEISAALPTARNDTSMLNEMQILASLQVASDVVTTLDLTENPAFLNPPSSLLSRTSRGQGLCARADPGAGNGAGDGPGRRRRRRPCAMQAAERLRANTVFHRVGRSFVVEIWFASHDPVLAADIVNAYAEAYIADGIRATVQSADERAAGWRRGCRTCGPRRRPRRRRPSSSAAMTGVADQQGLRDLEQQAEALERSRAAVPEPLPRTGARKLLPGVLGPHPVARPAAARSRRAARHPCACGGGVPRPSLGLAVAVLREARETGFRTGADVTRTWACRSWAMCRPTTARARKRPERACRPAISPNPTGISRRGRAPRGARGHAARTPVREGRPRRLQRPAIPARATRQPRDCRRLPATGRGQHGHRHRTGAADDPLGAALPADRRRFRRGGAEPPPRAGRGGRGARRAGGRLRSGGGPCGEMTEDLDILPAGRCADPDHAMAYLAEFGDLIGDLADGYDDIVVHLPPLLDTPEATGLLARADHTVLAVAWGRTPRQLVQGVVAETPGLRGPGAGVVLSRVALNRLSRYGVIRPRRNGWNSGRGTAKST